MPEIRFQIEWPDGAQETCYSPSLVVKDYFTPGEHYPLSDFVERSRTALTIASDRVKAKFGRPCGLAMSQLDRIEARAMNFRSLTDPTIRVIRFIE